MKRAGKLLLPALLAAVFVMAAVLPAATLFTASGAAEAAENGKQTLIIYNWADYIDEGSDEEGIKTPGIIEDFEAYYLKEYGIELEVRYSTFDTNEQMLTTVEQGGEKIDLICPSEYAIQRLMQGGYLQKLNKELLPNNANIDQDIYTKVDSVFKGISVPEVGDSESMSDYFVPYMWGTLGILYNTEYVKEADLAHGYGLLWNKGGNHKLDGKIMLKDSIRDSYVAAVLYMKENGTLPDGKYASLSVEELINTVDDTLLAAAEQVFIEQKEVGGGYEVDEGKNDMLNEKAYVSLQWSGDAVFAMEKLDTLDYFVPEIGGNIWFDGWVIPKNAQNTEAAHRFIDYLNRPEVAMRNSMYIGYVSAVDKDVLMGSAEAMAVLADNGYTIEDYFGTEDEPNEIRYPDINNSTYGVMKDFGEYNTAAIEMWERVKKPDLMWILWVVLAVVGAAAIGVGIYFIVKKKGSVRKVSKVASVNSGNGTAAAAPDDDGDESDEDEDDEDESEKE